MRHNWVDVGCVYCTKCGLPASMPGECKWKWRREYRKWLRELYREDDL